MSNNQSIHFEETTREGQVEYICNIVNAEFERVHTTREGVKNILTEECQAWLSETAEEVKDNIAVSIMQCPTATTPSDLTQLGAFLKEFADSVLETRTATRNKYGFATAITVDAEGFLGAKKRLTEQMDWLYLLK